MTAVEIVSHQNSNQNMGESFNKTEVKHTLRLLSQGNRECLEDLFWPLMLQPLKGHCREIIKAYPKVNKDGSGRHAEPLAQILFRLVSDLSVCYYPVCFSTRGLEMKTECGSFILSLCKFTFFPKASSLELCIHWIYWNLGKFDFWTRALYVNQTSSSYKLWSFLLCLTFLWQQSILKHIFKCTHLIKCLNTWVYF